MALKRLCRCGKVINIDEKYCNACSSKRIDEKRESIQHYDKNIRRNKEVYQNKIWTRLTIRCKAKFDGLDVYALYEHNEIVYGELSHHIKTVEDEPVRQFDITNLIYVSDRSHKEIHKAYNKDESTKKAMQDKLFRYIARYIKEYKG